MGNDAYEIDEIANVAFALFDAERTEKSARGGRCSVYLQLDRPADPRWIREFENVYSSEPAKRHCRVRFAGAFLVLEDCEFSEPAIQGAVDEAAKILPVVRERLTTKLQTDEQSRHAADARAAAQAAARRSVVANIKLPNAPPQS